MLGCQVASAQSRLKKAVSYLDVSRVNFALSDQATILSTSGCKDATFMSSLLALRAINSIGTHKGILLKFGQEIVYVDCENEVGKDGTLGQTFLESSSGAYGTVNSHSGCMVYEPRG